MHELPFSELIRNRMKERGLGLRELCRGAGLDPSFFSKVLAGKRNPPADEAALRRLAEQLELDPPRLIVSAGRIPSEWRRLWSDGELFHLVHRMTTGAKPAAAPKPTAAHKPAPTPRSQPESKPLPRVPARSFGEELL